MANIQSIKEAHKYNKELLAELEEEKQNYIQQLKEKTMDELIEVLADMLIRLERVEVGVNSVSSHFTRY